MPKTRAPATSGRSTAVLVGPLNSAPRTGRARRLARRKPTAATPTAPAITKARLGSQSPARSTKPSTFAASIIRETVSPSPNSKPAASETNSRECIVLSGSNDVAEDEDRCQPGPHEQGRRDQRALRQPGDAAHPMPAGAAAAEARS